MYYPPCCLNFIVQLIKFSLLVWFSFISNASCSFQMIHTTKPFISYNKLSKCCSSSTTGMEKVLAIKYIVEKVKKRNFKVHQQIAPPVIVL